MAGQAHGDEPGFEEGWELSPTTVWRCVGAFGQRTGTLAKASSLIRQKDPSCPIFRELVDVPRRKHRSEARRQVLIGAKELFRIALVCIQLLGVPLFHEFGTVGRYQLICGEGRFLAHKRLNKTEIAAEIISCDREEAHLISLVENIARVPANTMWFAKGVQRMRDAGMRLSEIAEPPCSYSHPESGY